MKHLILLVAVLAMLMSAGCAPSAHLVQTGVSEQLTFAQGVCVTIEPTDAGVGDSVNLTLYVDGEETDIAHLNIWDVQMWDWAGEPAVIDELTADMLAATGWHVEYGDENANEWEHGGGGTFAEAIAAGGFGDESCGFEIPPQP